MNGQNKIGHDVVCIMCQRTYSLAIDPDDMKRWQERELIQKAMPYLSANERELLISGICGKCFDETFKET
jgi:hypothetical protein